MAAGSGWELMMIMEEADSILMESGLKFIMQHTCCLLALVQKDLRHIIFV
jgi:hypothetical protein